MIIGLNCISIMYEINFINWQSQKFNPTESALKNPKKEIRVSLRTGLEFCRVMDILNEREIFGGSVLAVVRKLTLHWCPKKQKLCDKTYEGCKVTLFQVTTVERYRLHVHTGPLTGEQPFVSVYCFNFFNTDKRLFGCRAEASIYSICNQQDNAKECFMHRRCTGLKLSQLFWWTSLFLTHKIPLLMHYVEPMTDDFVQTHLRQCYGVVLA
jgi:hypothetical protein